MRNYGQVGNSYFFRCGRRRGMLPAVEVPLSIADCVLWYRPDLSVITNAGLVVGLLDLSNNDNDATCDTTVGKRLVVTPSDARYNGKETFVTTSTSIVTTVNQIVPGGSDRTVVFVGDGPSTTNLSLIQFSQDNAHRLSFYVSIQSVILFASCAGLSFALTSKYKTTLVPPTAYAWRYAGATKTVRLRDTGNNYTGSNSNMNTDDTGSTQPAAILFGPVSGVVGQVPTTCAELIVYKRQLTDAELNTLSAYIFARYQLTL